MSEISAVFNWRSLQRKVHRSLKRRGLWGTLERCAKEPFYVISEWRPSRLRNRRAQREFDRRFRVDTAGVISLSALDVANEHWESGFSYEPTDSENFKAVIGELPIRYEDFTFTDFGSGKGKALLLAAEFPFRKILGVEISLRLHQVAKQNIRNYRNGLVKCNAMESICSDATSFRISGEQTVFYFFNPFEEPPMARVLSNIEESLRKHPRRIYIVYKAPLFGFLMDRAGFLKKVKTERGYAVYTNADPTQAPDAVKVEEPRLMASTS